ncbi:hypothetical protein K8R33_00115 [archaeon]|nr:hypothetical protein [archaeon]
MEKIFPITVLILLLLLFSGCMGNDQRIKKQYYPPTCGNDLCEDDEEYYCLDCNLSCKSEICNSKINIICENCTKNQKELLPTLFEHQNIIYSCLSYYYGYNPPRLVYHIITSNQGLNSCAKEEGCYISGGGFAERYQIKQGFIPGLREYGEYDVTKKKNVGFEVHEMSHIFTSYGLGEVPAWFTEGIAIYTESRISCHKDQVLSGKFDEFLNLYEKLKNSEVSLNEIAPFDEYYNTKHNSHIIGSLYFGALEREYGCNKECIAKILSSLHQYREECTSICFQNAKMNFPELINFSMNNNDLRIPLITNSIIKQKSEQIIGEDLSYLFNLLEITY